SCPPRRTETTPEPKAGRDTGSGGISKNDAVSRASSGWIWNAGRLLTRLRPRLATTMQDFPVRCEGKDDADRLALVAQIIEHDAFAGRGDFLQAKGIRQESLEPRTPIGFQRRPALIDLHAIASAFQARVVRVQIHQRRKIALPARVQPVDDNGQ